MRTTLATVLGVAAIASLLCGCGKGHPPAEQRAERTGTRQAETTASETTAATRATGATGEGHAARSEADCRLVLHVADQDMDRKEAEAFSELLADMIRTMEGPTWTGGELRNAALDHLAVPRYTQCKIGEE
jgi:hypothetical protein